MDTNNNNKKSQNFSRIVNAKVGTAVEIVHRKIPDSLPNNINNSNKPATRNLRRRETSSGITTASAKLQLPLLYNSNKSSNVENRIRRSNEPHDNSFANDEHATCYDRGSDAPVTSKKSPGSTGLVENRTAHHVAGSNSRRCAGTALKQNKRFELNSVLSGRRKQNHNHLLNFHYAKLDVFSNYEERGHQSRNNTKYAASRFTKENFLQANFQFVIRQNSKPSFSASPDALIKWDVIEQINIATTEEPRCPICLYPPVAAKLTRCGHAFCWPCILHYLALQENFLCKCPICNETIHVEDLKSTAILQQKAINVNDVVTLQLMHRKRSSLYIEKYTVNSESREHFPFLGSNQQQEEGQKRFSKFILASRCDVNQILEREYRELSCGMDDPKSPEFTYVQMALDMLEKRRNKLGPIVKTADLPNGKNHGGKIEQISDSKDEQTDEMSAKVMESYYYFYQSIDGQNIYLHPLNVQMLQACYGCLEKSPSLINGRILEMEHYAMNDYMRRKFTCLAHLPLTRQFAVVELDLKPPIITADVFEMFEDEILNRQKERQRRQCEEFTREKKINELHDRQMGKLVSSTVDLNIASSREFPTWGFDIPLVPQVNEEASASTSPAVKPQASYSAALTIGGVTSCSDVTTWPILTNNSASNNTVTKVKAGCREWTISADTAAPTYQRSAVSESESTDYVSICEDPKIAPTTPTTLSDVLAEAISKRETNATNAQKATAKTKKGKKKPKGEVCYSNVFNYGYKP